MRYTLEFGLLALALVGLLCASFYTDVQLPMYFAWLIAATIVTFAFYGLDKGLARFERLRVRVPELVLNLLALGGGFVGAWFGRLVWRHKTNIRKHQTMLLILLLGTLLHTGGIYLWATRWR
jgi:uncharacterized membrane protein YsdA (DUF1294 family)